LTAARLTQHLKKFIEQHSEAKVDYVHFFDPETFEPAKTVSRGAHLAMAVFVGKTRLIDNASL
jgi:pantoate--beta-alanine ligase